MPEAVILSAVRTPIGKFQGGLAGFSAMDLGALAVKTAVARAGLSPEQVGEVIMGNVLQAGLGQNPARQAALAAGIPPGVASFTVNKVCGSGMKSVMLATQAIRLGDEQVVVAGGMESMTNTPYMLPGARDGLRLGDGKIVDLMVHDGLWDKYNNFHMGLTGELIAKELNVTRAEQDAFAAESHRRAHAATVKGEFKREIVPVEVKPKKGDPFLVEHDEGVRGDTTAEALAKMRPAFDKAGTVTAGNASQISDGAAALALCSDGYAKANRLTPRARIVACASGGDLPARVMFAPIIAVRNLLAKMGVGIDHFQLLELNEPFAAASVGVMRELHVNPEIANIRGGAVALGHPIGASGARIIVTLLHALEDRGLERGLAGLCLGGGNAVCIAIERV
jgi:acetyl-CoA C-acetyltransferase